MSVVCGLVLAAGAGARYGGPKALARTPDGVPWMSLVADTLTAAGCDPVFVALGARSEDALALLPPGCTPLIVADWAQGLSATLRATLAAAATTEAAAAVVVPVDVPALPRAAVDRVIAAARHTSASALVRAVYRGEPGHPVLLGRAHWASIARTVAGDTGAGAYLRAHGAAEVECGDLWHGGDVDAEPCRTAQGYCGCPPCHATV